MENNSCIKQCLFLLSAMPLQVPVHSHSNCRPCYQSRYTSFRCALLRTRLLNSPPVFLVIVGGLSGIIFTCIVMLASFITTFFISVFEEPTYYYSPFSYVSPLDLAHDLITAALRILNEGDIIGTFNDCVNATPSRRTRSTTDSSPSVPKAGPTPGLVKNFIRRFVLGLPMVGAGSLAHMLLSAPLLGPLHWLARQRGSRRRRDQSRDIAAMIIIVLIVVGAARFVTVR
jgi:hypothetical protein